NSHITTKNCSPIVTKQNTLPSGPTDPPVSHFGPCSTAFERCPCITIPLFGTEYRKVSPQSKLACSPTAYQRFPVRRSVKQKNNPTSTTLAAPTQPSPGFPRCTAPNPTDSTMAAHQKPSPSPSVNCVYPRKKNSSKNPTHVNSSRWISPQRKISFPCSAKLPNE